MIKKTNILPLVIISSHHMLFFDALIKHSGLYTLQCTLYILFTCMFSGAFFLRIYGE